MKYLKKVGQAMVDVVEWAKGKKTYSTAISLFVVGLLHVCGVEVPPFIWATAAALGLGFLRAAVKKAEI